MKARSILTLFSLILAVALPASGFFLSPFLQAEGGSAGGGLAGALGFLQSFGQVGQGFQSIRQNFQEARQFITEARDFFTEVPDLPPPQAPGAAGPMGPPGAAAVGVGSSAPTTASTAETIASLLSTTTGRQSLGLTEEQSRALEAAQQAGLNPLGPREAEPQNCRPSNYTCQFTKACYPCLSSLNQPECPNCLQLESCLGALPCQLQWVCKLCKKLPRNSNRYWPPACDKLECDKKP